MKTRQVKATFDASGLHGLTLSFLEANAKAWQNRKTLPNQVAFFLFARQFRCFEAIDALVAAGYGPEALILLRSQLEALVDLIYVMRSDQEQRALDWIAHADVEGIRLDSLRGESNWSKLIETPEELRERAQRWKRLKTAGRARLSGLSILIDDIGPTLAGFTHTASFSLEAYGEPDKKGNIHYKLGPIKSYAAEAYGLAAHLLRLSISGLCVYWRVPADDAYRWLDRFDKLISAGPKRIRQRKTNQRASAVFSQMTESPKNEREKLDVSRWETVTDELDLAARELINRHNKPSCSTVELFDMVYFLFLHRIFRSFRGAAGLAHVGFVPESFILIRTSFEALIDLAFITLSDQRDERFADWAASGFAQRLRTSGALVYLPDQWAEAIGSSTEVAERAKRWQKMSFEKRATASDMKYLYDEVYRELSGWMHGTAWTRLGYLESAVENMTRLALGPNKFWPNAAMTIRAHNLNCSVLRGTISLLCVLWKLPLSVRKGWLAKFVALTAGLLVPPENLLK
jgi:hypothetical protein